MTVEHTAIESMTKAGRYLAELAGTVGFDEALKRVRSRSSDTVAAKLDRLGRYARGEESADLPGELELLGLFMRQARGQASAGAGMAALSDALVDARALAANVRLGLPGDLTYSAALLGIAASIWALWLTYIAPGFVELYDSVGARLPALSQAALAAPWLPFLVIGMLAAIVALLAIGARALAAAIEALAPMRRSSLRLVCGARVLGAHDRWRAATMANAWAAAGLAPVRALRDAVAQMSANGGELRGLIRDVELADAMGLGRHELDYVRRQSLETYRTRLEGRRAVALRVMQIAIAVLVAVIVITIYEPIFGMGAVI